MNFQIVTKVRALGKKYEMRKGKHTRNNLVRLLLLNTKLVLRVAHYGRSGSEVALASERERRRYILNFNRLSTQQGHVATYLLKIQRRHSDVGRKLSFRQLDIGLVAIQKIELVPRHLLLLTIFK